mmetsp:Transcript_29918/g.53557  ORF Transcript_29918/g.53557 Transcript_29918/m.53557 type:complete len:117 (-) Transcript_29918:78-428(-)|eukprot:CAMPEP_0177796340 /NCGR_PEP_ID=MMETSP0491_2-20121128/26726_1 /TAXON_ID=63592 /ORGANISM="Tetraselmis chuii, Strain PLY429" /LENGTH=116 /DNA_ID=CAMNT_0019319255 /DNA_START=274 /DNA_END=624 /DNA_ORIENTATION=-
MAPRGTETASRLTRWRECMSGQRQWEKDLLLDTLHWLRQILAIFFGILFGALPMKGAVPFFTFSGINLFAGFLFYRSFRIDEEDFGGHAALVQEGMGPAASLFMVIWIVVYSTFSV